MTARFVTFEGLDGSGKSTHLARAAEWLRARGDEVLTTREPGGTPLADAIRDLFLDPRWQAIDGRVEALLVFASRRQHLVEVIEPTLARGVHVLCDRFTDSSIAYQGVARGLGLDWVRKLDQLATGGRRPDATLLFDLDPAEARRRGQKHGRKGSGPDRLDAESLAFYERVRAGFHQQAHAEPERFHLVTTEDAVDVTWARVAEVLAEVFA
ncbi:MAG: dTMP kinase [Acidobacteriota bacterium]